MKPIQISFIFLFAFIACTLAWGNGNQNSGYGGMSGGYQKRGAGGYMGGQGQNYEGGMGGMGRMGRQYGGMNGDSGKKYRTNLYNDDDVYGYDANYPNGEAAYINYRSKDARARRGQEFARTSRAYSRGGGMGGGYMSNGYMSGGMGGYMAGGMGGGMGGRGYNQMQGQGMW